MAPSDELKALVAQLPTADKRGMYTEGMDRERIEKAVAAIAKGGPRNVHGLIAMLGEPGSEDDVQPRFALHCVLNHALVTGDEKLRRDFCQVLAEQLGNESLLPQNRVYLCHELQWAGRDEACAALGRLLLDDNLTDAAATALVAIGGERAAAPLRAAVPQAKGKSRLNLIDALAALSDAKSAAVFEPALADADREVRIAAAAGLANLGQASSADRLLKAAASAHGWERTQLTKSCLVLAEKLAAAGDKPAARRVYERLQTTRAAQSEQHVRDAAARGLKALTAAIGFVLALSLANVESARAEDKDAKDGWVALFEGQSLAGWTDRAGKAPSAGWAVTDGALTRKSSAGDIWTAKRYGDFVLDLEFKTNGNSGVFIRTDNPKDNVQTGIEVQVDKPGGPGKHSVGAVYDLQAPTKNAAKPDWNRLVVTAQGSRLQVDLNGERIVEMDLARWTEPNKNPDGSKNKFKTALKDFKREGHIGFQDHGAEVSYRNVRIKPL